MFSVQYPAHSLLQWGRDHLIAEIVNLTESRRNLGLLQWGRDHLIAEMVTQEMMREWITRASMGPRSSDRGNQPAGVTSRAWNGRFNGAAII